MSDPIAALAAWLAGNVEWMRHRAEADEFLAAVDACARVVRGIARGPAEQKYLGPCGADLDALNTEVTTISGHCEGDVYASRGSRTGRCRLCGAEVSTGDREAWLDGEVRSHAFTAAAIAEAYRVNVKTIRTWANRGALRTYWVTDAGLTVEWTDPSEDEPRERLHYVGDVLDLAAADAARRATEQAKRARRAAAKAAETDERMTA